MPGKHSCALKAVQIPEHVTHTVREITGLRPPIQRRDVARTSELRESGANRPYQLDALVQIRPAPNSAAAADGNRAVNFAETRIIHAVSRRSRTLSSRASARDLAGWGDQTLNLRATTPQVPR
jgi:hypothetical protein